MKVRSYIAIDLKSFYASVECIQRGLDPMATNLVVADPSRTDKTICLAVSPSLKSFGIPGRPRLFEVVQKIGQVNALRKNSAPGRAFTGKSHDYTELRGHPELEVDYIVAPPQMAFYMETSAAIYNIYLKYVAPEDIHPYSIDEVFIDATNYLKLYRMTPEELAMKIILDILENTGITATAGIGTNLYLAKVAMDIVAKHIPADKNGVRIAQLDELRYRQELWSHRPLTDFWRVGPGYAKKLEKVGLRTMGDVARCSVGKPTEFYNEDLLYKLFGVNAQLLIDHAWGWEPCTIDLVKAYRPESNSFSNGQVLSSPYPANKARVVALEMADSMALNLVDKHLVTDQIVLHIGYDAENLSNPAIVSEYFGPVATDHYGRKVPKPAHGTARFQKPTSSSRLIIDKTASLFDEIVNMGLLIRYINISVGHVVNEDDLSEEAVPQQLDLFADYDKMAAEAEKESAALQKERKIQEAQIAIKRRFGKNAILKGLNFEEGATAIERNRQIGGHKA